MSSWIDAKKEKPHAGKMVWAACPNVVICKNQVFLAYIDNDNWYGENGLGLGRKVNFWQYADVPECNISC